MSSIDAATRNFSAELWRGLDLWNEICLGWSGTQPEGTVWEKQNEAVLCKIHIL